MKSEAFRVKRPDISVDFEGEGLDTFVRSDWTF
jgi:hypothetical protein